LWRSDKDKVKKLLDSIAQESGRKRVKHLQRLRKYLSDDLTLLKDAPQVLFSCVTDNDEDVWNEVQHLSGQILSRKASLLRRASGALVPHVKLPGRTRKRALALLKMMAGRKKGLVKDFVPILMREITTGDQEEEELMLDILMRLGVNAKEYIKTAKFIERTLEIARNSGADITEAERLFEEAKGLMVSKGINEFLMMAKKAELMARYAKKVTVIWRDFIQDIGEIAISDNGRMIAVSVKNEVLLYSNEKEILQRFAVEGDVSAIKFTPDSKTILIGTEGRMLYLVNTDSDFIWKRRRGGVITAISVATETEEIFVGSDDSNVSLLSMDGMETSRQWTEKPAVCLDVDGNGGTLVLSMGDHNIFSYDKKLFQKWKYMGGIWTDLAVSSLGDYIFGGTQGGDVVCLSRSGVPVWKKTLGAAIERVFLNPVTDCFIVGTKQGLFCYDKTGKVLWTYLTKEPLKSFDATTNGESIIISTEKGMYLLENREAHKHFLSELRASLKTMESFGIDMSGAEDLIMKANASFESNDYKQGARFVNDIKKLIEKAKLERGTVLLVLAEKKLSDAKDRGINVSEGESVLHRAESLINRGDFDGAINEAKHALQIARMAESARVRTEKVRKEKRKQEVKKVIEVAVSMIDDAVNMGIDTSEAEDLLQAAITASDEGEFDQCIIIVKELDEVVKKQKKVLAGKTEANYAKALSLVDKEDTPPEVISKTVDDISRAAKYYEHKQSLSRAAECYDILARLERKRDNIMLSRTYYQRSINTYFKIGELEKVAKIIMRMMKELEGEGELPIYEVEDAFLIFKDGRLIGHHTVRLRPEMDREILGGMLVAIQNFVEDSLMASSSGMLNELRYGRTRILIQRGKFLTLALVITGSEARDLWQRMLKMIEDIEQKYEEILAKWDGDMDKLWGVKNMFEQNITQL
jgi:tetratricopeptide (TPR) repeat protein